MDKSCVPVAILAVSEKSTDIVDKVPTAFGFAVIISTVGSYQVWVYFINSLMQLGHVWICRCMF